MPPAPRPRPRSVLLSEIADLLLLPSDPDAGSIEISGVTLNSGGVLPGDLFAALGGYATHGGRFAGSAVAAGAVAVFTDAEGAALCAHLEVPVLVVANPRSWLGSVAALVYGYPGSAMQMIGVTGTNGKTTVAAMVEAGLRSAGRVTGMIGTIGIRIADREFSGIRTTPEATDLQAILAVMREAGVTSVVMEVSSIAIDEHRVNGVIYDIAAFTNLSQDHLDYHGSMEHYFAAKSSLFNSTRARRAVIGIDDDWGRRLAEISDAEIDTWSTISNDADWTLAPTGSGVVVEGPEGERQPIVVPLAGAFNIANALCAYVILRRAGVTAIDATDGIAAARVPGRMQVIDDDRGVVGIVDYAHSPDAIERVLKSVGASATGRIIAVLGAGGDRDRGKRSQMGSIAARLADVLVITDDNPRSELPASIREAIHAGALEVPSGERAEIHEDGDRRRAITVAVGLATSGDVVVVLGKGHEQGQEVDGVMTPFDDAAALTEALSERRVT